MDELTDWTRRKKWSSARQALDVANEKNQRKEKEHFQVLDGFVPIVFATCAFSALKLPALL